MGIATRQYGPRRVATVARRVAACAAAAVIATVLVSCSETGSASTPRGGGGATSSTGGARGAGTTRLTPAQIEDALVAASRYIEQGEPVKAEIILADLVTKAPGLSRAHELLGKAAFHQATAAEQSGDDAQARRLHALAADQYDEAVRLDPASAGLASSAGEIALRAGRVERALEHFRAAGRLDPADSRTAMLEASILLTLGRISGARTAIDRAMQLDPEEPYILATLAAVQKEEGDIAGALQTVRRARGLARSELQPAFRALEAKFLRQSGDPGKALELLRPLPPAVRAEAAVTTELAAAYEAMGMHERAAEVWAHRFETTREWSAAVEVARSAAKAGLMDEAWSWHRQVRLILGGHPAVTDLEDELRAIAARRDGTPPDADANREE